MPDEKKEHGQHFCGSGSSKPGKPVDPKEMPEVESKPRAVPIGLPISADKYKKLKEKARTDS